MFAPTQAVHDLRHETALISYLAKSLDKFHRHAVNNPASRLAELKIIHLRGPKKLEAPSNYSYDLSYVDCEDRDLMASFPEVTALVSYVKGQLQYSAVGNVMLSLMLPGAFIQPHFDPGPYFEHYHRLHVPLLSDEDCRCYSLTSTKQIKGECMRVGHVWELNNSDVHWFEHRGTGPRYHLVMDAR